MQTFAQKQNQSQKQDSAGPAPHNAAPDALTHPAYPAMQLTDTPGNQVRQRLQQALTQKSTAAWTSAASPRGGRDFRRVPIRPSQVPARPTGAGAVQPKVTVNTAGNEYEQEANRAAERVMRMSEAPRQAAYATGASGPNCQAAQVSDENKQGQTGHIQAGLAGKTLSPAAVHETSGAAGQSLDAATRSFMEPRFGHDFSRVRVHDNAGAARRADELGALAYTVGNEIGFAAGNYKPETPTGRALLAHELAHVVQKSEGRDAPQTPRCAAAISVDSFSVADAPSTSIVVTPFPTGKSFIALKTDNPGLVINAAVNVNCSGGTAAGYEVGIVQFETSEFSEANYFGLTPADGSLVARKSQLRKPAGVCSDSREGAFWTADAAGEKSLKPPACGAGIALPTFSDAPSESYFSWIENRLTHKPNYIRDVKVAFAFVDALAVKTPSGSINVLKWLRWGVNWTGHFNTNASAATPTGVTEGSGYWAFGDDSVRPSEIPTTYVKPAKTCVEIAQEAASSDFVVEENASY